jgi:hypothetical protein
VCIDIRHYIGDVRYARDIGLNFDIGYWINLPDVGDLLVLWRMSVTDIGEEAYSDIRYNVGLIRLHVQYIRLSPISFITDIELNAHIYLNPEVGNVTVKCNSIPCY